MPIWRLQTSFQMDSALPRDQLVITPHFDDHGAFTDPTGLATDLATALGSWMVSANKCQINVRAYDAQGTKPVFPQANVVRNPGVTASSAYMREVALCLSFYAGQNTPTHRGRLYIPFVLGFTPPESIGVRPSSTHRDKIAALVPIFAGLGGADVDWVVYSRKEDTARKVTNYWVDDEWDVQRSRGLRSTTRTQGTTSG